MKRKKPKFLPQGYWKKKRIKKRWRRPRGIDSKMRVEKSYVGRIPKIGWRKPRKERGIHPSGLEEILIHSPQELDDVAWSGKLVRIASSVGRKKREDIIKKATKLGLRVI